MARPTKRDKAAALLADGRVRVTSANEHGIRALVQSSGREPYHVAYGVGGGRVIAECDCDNGRMFDPPRCSHLEAVKLIYGVAR